MDKWDNNKFDEIIDLDDRAYVECIDHFVDNLNISQTTIYFGYFDHIILHSLEQSW